MGLLLSCLLPAINRRPIFEYPYRDHINLIRDTIFEYPYWDLHINLPLVHKLALMPPLDGGGLALWSKFCYSTG